MKQLFKGKSNGCSAECLLKVHFKAVFRAYNSVELLPASASGRSGVAMQIRHDEIYEKMMGKEGLF